MATHHLGPESPSPFSVLSESYTTENIRLSHVPEYELYSFGEDYDRRICELIQAYLALDVDDSVCYVGDSKGNLAPMLQKRLCLLNPIVTVVPGHIHCQETPSHKTVPVKIAYVGAEEFFRQQSKSPDAPMFNKILLKDAIPYLQNPKETYIESMRILRSGGRLLIVHRPAALNTLPLPNDAVERYRQIDHEYRQIVEQLQALRYNVTWDIEMIPIKMSKNKWYTMLKNKFPPQLELISNYEINMGIRELSEGILKYNGDMIEFYDRLLFICAQRSDDPQHPSLTRARNQAGQAGRLHYQMEVPDELEPYIRDKYKTQRGSKQNSLNK